MMCKPLNHDHLPFRVSPHSALKTLMHLNMNLIVCLLHSTVDILKHKDHLLNSMLYPFMLFMANELMKCEILLKPSFLFALPEMSFRSQEEVNASVI